MCTHLALEQALLQESRWSEGLPVPIKTALETERRQDAESEVSIERPEHRMCAGSVRRDGTGNPGALRLTRMSKFACETS
jgi:hypothetical protein